MFIYESERLSDNAFDLFYTDNMNYPIHLHRCFEFVYLLEGELKLIIDNNEQTLHCGDIVLLLPNQFHSYSTHIFSKCIVCIFAPEYVNTFYQYTKNKIQKNPITKLSRETVSYILKNLPLCKNNRFLIKACLYSICSEIYEKNTFIEQKASNYIVLQKILTYIEDNYTSDEISLKSLAKIMGYDYQYLSRYINKQFKMTFPTLLNEYRTRYAMYLIENSDKTITEIALNCGYKSIRSFNRNFNQIVKKNPSEYKSDCQENNL